MTTLTALARSGTFLNAGPLLRGFMTGFSGALAAGLMVVFSVSIAVAVAHAGRVMPGVRVAGVDVGGLDRAAALARLEAGLPSLSAGALTVSVDETRVALPYGDLDRAYRLDAMLDAAFAVARSGDLIADAASRIRVLAQPASVPAMASGGDEGALTAIVTGLVDRFTVAPRDASVTYDPARGFSVTPAVEGARLSAADVRQALAGVQSRADLEGYSVSLSTSTLPPAISTRQAEAAAAAANRVAAMPLSLRGASEPLSLEPAALAALLSFEVAEDGSYGPAFDEAALTALIEPFAARVASHPRDAAFEWGPSGITGVVPAVEGRELDVAASVASVMESLSARARGAVHRSAALAVIASQPLLTTQAAQAAAPQMRRISTWTTYYAPGEGNYWNANIHIPAWDLDELVVAPGEWFSFWNDIGPVTVERGYGYGGVIIGGRSVANGALAGGICSTSTTLFNSAMRAGLEIGDRANHSYYIERYPVGLDATVLKTDTWAQDMTFRNDTANPIVIRSYTGNGWVRFDLWGVPDGRTVRLSDPVTSNHRTAIETTVVNPDLASGTSRRVEYPHNGFHAVVTRWVYDAQGDLLHENVWTSAYRTVNGITEVGPKRDRDRDQNED